MSVPLMLTFVSTVVFAIQLLIFAYLYSSHRVRFFRYLLLAWGAYTLSKGLKLVDVFVLHLSAAELRHRRHDRRGGRLHARRRRRAPVGLSIARRAVS